MANFRSCEVAPVVSDAPQPEKVSFLIIFLVLTGFKLWISKVGNVQSADFKDKFFLFLDGHISDRHFLDRRILDRAVLDTF